MKTTSSEKNGLTSKKIRVLFLSNLISWIASLFNKKRVRITPDNEKEYKTRWVVKGGHVSSLVGGKSGAGRSYNSESTVMRSPHSRVGKSRFII